MSWQSRWVFARPQLLDPTSLGRPTGDTFWRFTARAFDESMYHPETHRPTGCSSQRRQVFESLPNSSRRRKPSRHCGRNVADDADALRSMASSTRVSVGRQDARGAGLAHKTADGFSLAFVSVFEVSTAPALSRIELNSSRVSGPAFSKSRAQLRRFQKLIAAVVGQQPATPRVSNLFRHGRVTD